MRHAIDRLLPRSRWQAFKELVRKTEPKPERAAAAKPAEERARA